MKNKIKLSLITTALLIGSLSFPAVSFADNQEPILIEISDTDIGTEAFEQLISYGNGGHSAMGAILGDAQTMLSNPGIGFSIGSGGNGYRPTILIAVWTDQPFSVSAGLDTIKSHFNVPSNPLTTNGDCAIACDGTTQVEEIVVTTTTQVEEIVAPVQMSESLQTAQPEPIVDNTEPYISPTTTTTTVVESVNLASAFVAPVLTEKLISSTTKLKPSKIKVCKSKACKPKVCKSKACKPKVCKSKACKPKVIKSNTGKKVLTKAKQPIK
jgi:hypothetical protein